MKKLSWLMMLMTAMTLSLVGCGEDKPTAEPNPEPKPEPTELTFDVEITEVTKARAFFEVTPSDVEAEYMVMVYDAEFVDSFSKDEYLVGAIYEDITEYANTKGLTLKEYLAENVDKGVITDGSVSGLAVSSDYSLIVFGLDVDSIVFGVEGEDDNYALTSAVSRNPFTTQDAPVSDATFDVTATVDKNTVEFEVVPSDKQIYWHLMTLPQESIDYYLSAEGGMTLQSFYMRYAQQEIDQLLGLGYSPNDVINAIFLQGDLTLTAKGLDAYTEYGYLIAGFVLDEDGTYLATGISKGVYTTQEPRYTGMTFEISVTDIEKTRAAIKVTPSSLTDKYFWLIGNYDGKSTADELMDKCLVDYGFFMQLMASYTGVQDFTGVGESPYKYRLDCDNTEYFILVFGYDGGVTSEPYMVKFKTLPGLEADQAEFTMEATNITTFGADVKITSNDESVQYIVDVLSPSEFNEAAIIENTNGALAEMYMQAKQTDPNVTYASLFCSSFWRGDQTMKVSGLTANTEVMGYILALDDKTGKAVKMHVFNPLFSTTADGNINPTVVNKGVFSGAEEAGTIFGDAALTKDYAIAVVKIENYDGAESLYFTSVEGDYAYEAAYSDGYMMTNFGWASKNSSDVPYTEDPYIFTLLFWAKDYTFAAYAVDERGGAGKIGRLLINANAKDKQPIEDLQALYDEASGKTEAYVPGSIVVENKVVRTNAVITSMEAPVVEKQSVAAANKTLQPELLQLGYVKRHTLRD